MAPIPLVGPLASRAIRFILSSRLLLALAVVYAWVGALPFLFAVRWLGRWMVSASGNLSLLFPLHATPPNVPSRRTKLKSSRTGAAGVGAGAGVRQRTLSRTSSILADSSPLSPPLPVQPPPSSLPAQAHPPRRRTRKRSSTSARVGATTASTITTTQTHTNTLRPLPHQRTHHHDLDDSITTSTSITATLPHIPPLSILRTPSTHFASATTSWPYQERYFLLANNLRVHYIDVVPPARPATAGTSTSSSASSSSPANNLKTVVLLHGVLGYSASAFAKHVPMLLDLGYRVIALDFPGHGKSDKPLDVHNAHTFGLYVTALIDLFTHVFNTDPSSPPPASTSASSGPVAVLAQGVAATFLSLALAASPLVAKIVTHLVLVSPNAPPGESKRLALVHVLGARACAHLVLVLPHWCVPSMHTVARAIGGAVSARDAGWDVPGTSVKVPLTVLGKFPVPYLAEVPTERILALFDIPEARTPATGSLSVENSVVGGGWASPGQASFDSAIAGLAAVAGHDATHVKSRAEAPGSISNRLVTLVVGAIAALGRVSDRVTALDLQAAHLHLREWAHSPPPPPPPPPPQTSSLSSSGSFAAPPLPPPRRQILVLYGTKDGLVGGGKHAAEQWARACDAQRMVGVQGVGALVGGEGAVACVDAVCEFLDASVGG